jgi:hypothetical protein
LYAKFVHKRARQVDTPAGTSEKAFRTKRIRKVIRIKALTLIGDYDL